MMTIDMILRFDMVTTMEKVLNLHLSCLHEYESLYNQFLTYFQIAKQFQNIFDDYSNFIGVPLLWILVSEYYNPNNKYDYDEHPKHQVRPNMPGSSACSWRSQSTSFSSKQVGVNNVMIMILMIILIIIGMVMLVMIEGNDDDGNVDDN